jgi:RND family efflux transporter MFP subunit
MIRITTGLAAGLRLRRLLCPALAAFVVAVPVLGNESQALAPLAPLDCVLEPFEVVEVSSAVQGVINEIHVDRNDMVEKGQLLVELDADVERTQVELARERARLKTAIELRETELAFNLRNQQRLEKLYEKDTISLHIKDEAETDTQKSELQLRSARENKRLAELELAKAEAVLALRSMRSPISGVVVARNKVAGEFVEDQSILRLAQLNPLKVEVIAPVELFGSITEGMQVEVRPEQAGQEAQYATVTMVDRMIDPASGTFDVRAELPNPELAIPSGLRCTALFREEPAVPEAIAAAPVEEPATTVQEEPAATLPEETATGSAEILSLAEIHVSAKRILATEPAVDAETAIEAADIAEQETFGEVETILEADSLALETPDGEEEPGAETGPAPGVVSTERAQPAEEVVFAASIPVDENFCASENHTEIAGYRVLVDPEINSYATRDLVDKLLDNGVQDIYVVAKGANQGQISLGYYSQRDNAEQRQREVANHGFDVSLVPRTREVQAPDCETGSQLAGTAP